MAQSNDRATLANVMNGPRPENPLDSTSRGKRRWLIAVYIVLAAVFGLAALSFRFVVFEPFSIPSGSIYPTLSVGDYVFVSKYSYGYSRYSFPYGLTDFEGRIWARPVARGDVVVFRNPSDDQIDYVMRIVGMPGERVQIRGGILHIDGTPVSRERIADFPLPPGKEAPQYLETLPGGKVHPILETQGDRSWTDSTREFTVPAAHYFVLGDNRDNAADSRFVGPVPYDHLIGRVKFVFYSGHFDRIFKPIE